MDEILDPFLPSSSWSEVNSPQGSSWVRATASQTSSILPEPYKKIEQNPTVRVIPSGQMLGGLQFHEFDMHLHDESGLIFVADDLKYGINPCYFPIDNLPQQDVSNHISLESQHEKQIPEKGYSLPAATESNPAAGSFCVDHGSVGSNDNEPSVFPQSLEDSQSTSGVPPLWTSAYSSVPSLAMDQVNLQNFGRVQGEFLESEVDILGRRCNDGELQQDVFPRLLNEQKDLHNSEVLSVTPGSQMNLTGNNCMRSNSQLSQGGRGNSIQHYTSNTQITQAQPIPANTNSTPKPRRARRGQATDPHSIAERLRREKIAERMKNLQGLVPNSNKTDKASMLDEIIDYVKFLQLQVKVLSMSRVGAAGAVVPLITEIQPDGTGSLLLSPSVDLGGTDLSESDDNLEFEHEVVKLMESNVTTAMQYLQMKGLCLMPTALAAAISSRKGSSTTSIPPGKKKPDAPIHVISPNNEPMKKVSDDRSELPKGCNGIVIKQEDSQKSSSKVRDLKPKALRGDS